MGLSLVDIGSESVGSCTLRGPGSTRSKCPVCTSRPILSCLQSTSFMFMPFSINSLLFVPAKFKKNPSPIL